MLLYRGDNIILIIGALRKNLVQLLTVCRQFDGYGLTPEPESHERQPPSNRDGDTTHPWPGGADLPGARELVVGEMAHGDSVLLFDVREEGTLVVDFEVKDAVLIWERKGCAIDRRIDC